MKEKSLKKNFAYNFLYQLLAIIVPLITSPYLARTLGAENIGIASWTNSIVFYFGMFIVLGVENYGNREIAYVRASRVECSKKFWSIYACQLINFIIVLMLYFFYVNAIAKEYKVIFAILTMSLLTKGLDIAWFFSGMEEFKITVVRNSVVKIITLTCGLAADILFYSFSEWVLYATDPHLAEMGSIQDWAGVYPLFHWSFIPWGFYLVLAVAFGFMLHVRKRNRQKYSEACRPILGKHTDGWAGRIIDLLAVFALLAGTATTFSVATPLMATIISELFHVAVSRTVINIIILLITCAVYTYSLLHGFKGISKLANICIYMFFGLIAFVLLFGGETRYIIETGFSSLGRMIQNFVDLSTFTDPLRTSNFPQNWTIYYWAYWMVWCVAAPFFIGSISRGRTVRQTILGGYVFGVGSTLTSFIVLGNYP